MRRIPEMAVWGEVLTGLNVCQSSRSPVSEAANGFSQIAAVIPSAEDETDAGCGTTITAFDVTDAY